MLPGYQKDLFRYRDAVRALGRYRQVLCLDASDPDVPATSLDNVDGEANPDHADLNAADKPL